VTRFASDGPLSVVLLYVLVKCHADREKIQVVQGTGFNWPHPDHFRIVTLPWADDLDAAISRIGRFLAGYKQ